MKFTKPCSLTGSRLFYFRPSSKYYCTSPLFSETLPWQTLTRSIDSKPLFCQIIGSQSLKSQAPQRLKLKAVIYQGTDPRGGSSPPWQEERVTVDVVRVIKKTSFGWGAVITSQSVQQMHILTAQLGQHAPLTSEGRLLARSWTFHKWASPLVPPKSCHKVGKA